MPTVPSRPGRDEFLFGFTSGADHETVLVRHPDGTEEVLFAGTAAEHAEWRRTSSMWAEIEPAVRAQEAEIARGLADILVGAWLRQMAEQSASATAPADQEQPPAGC